MVLILGLWWIRGYVSWPGLHLDVRRSLPYLRFGLLFFASSVLATAFGASGETMLRAVTGDYAQVGYFGLALRVFTTLSMVVSQLALAFTPMLVTLRLQERGADIGRWAGRLLKYMAVGAVVASYGTLLLGDDLVPMVLGQEYDPVAGNLVLLTCSLVPLAAAQVARLLATVQVLPREALLASAIELVGFWIVGLPLVAWLGSLGASIATLAARCLNGVYFTWRMRQSIHYSLRGTAIAVGLGMVFLPLAWLRSSLIVNVALFAVFCCGYLALLLLLQVITRDEVSELWRVVRSRDNVRDPGGAATD
jgi:O-antigen/teichoic acid export membrane protein